MSSCSCFHFSVHSQYGTQTSLIQSSWNMLWEVREASVLEQRDSLGEDLETSINSALLLKGQVNQINPAVTLPGIRRQNRFRTFCMDLQILITTSPGHNNPPYTYIYWKVSKESLKNGGLNSSMVKNKMK